MKEELEGGIHRRVTGNCLLPTNCMSFLRNNENKAGLFPYSSNATAKVMWGKVVVSIVNENVVINRDGLEISFLMPSNMKETDERISVRVKHTSREHTRIMIKTVSSNVVVIAIANCHQLVLLNELSIEFGARKLLRFIPIYQIAWSLGSNKSLAFPCIRWLRHDVITIRERQKKFFLTSGHLSIGLLHYLKNWHRTKSVAMNLNYLRSLREDYIEKLATRKK